MDITVAFGLLTNLPFFIMIGSSLQFSMSGSSAPSSMTSGDSTRLTNTVSMSSMSSTWTRPVLVDPDPWFRQTGCQCPVMPHLLHLESRAGHLVSPWPPGGSFLQHFLHLVFFCLGRLSSGLSLAPASRCFSFQELSLPRR